MRNFTIILIASLLASCSSFFCTDGNGVIVKEKRDLVGFNKIEMEGNGKLVINQGEKWSVEIEADSNVISKVITELNDDELTLSLDGVCPSALKYIITMPNISEIEVEGSGDANISGKFKSEYLDIEVEGSGVITINEIEVGKLDVEIEGSGDVSLLGSAEEAHVNIKGSGDLNAIDFEIEDMDIEINGSGNASFTANEELRIKINGSGNISYKGKPDLVQEIDGSGEVTNLK